MRLAKKSVTRFTSFWLSLAVVLLVVLQHLAVATAQEHYTTSNYTQFFGGVDNEAYLNWFETTGRTSYQAFVYLPTDVVSSSSSQSSSSGGAAVHWALKDVSSIASIELAIVVRATGWLGFGISGNGGMTGSDLFLFEAAKPDVVQDAYVAESKTMPTLDCQQDWELLNSSTPTATDGGFLIVQVRRALDTGDVTQDLNIFADAGTTIPVQRVIAAWGDSETVSFHGNNRARGAIRWTVPDGSFSSSVLQMQQTSSTAASTSASTTSSTVRFADEEFIFKNKMLGASDGFFEIVNTNYSIKPIETEYVDYCLTADDLRAQGVPLDNEQGVTVIGIDPIVTSRYVHHFTVYASIEENNGDTGCNGTYMQMVYAWAPGEPALVLPDNIGLPVGGSDPSNFRSFRINYHYDNKDLVEGGIDSSGIRYYYTSAPRQHAMGILQLGDPFTQLFQQPVGEGVSEHSFVCQPSCAAAALGSDSQPHTVTVFREMLHMHTSGIRSENLQYRNGTLIRRGAVDYFDFDQQGGQYVMQEPFQIQAGDSFETKCYYRNNKNNDDTQAATNGRIFGLGSHDEMCIAFLSYYPRMSIAGEYPWICGYNISLLMPPCDSSHESKLVTDDSTSIGRVFGTSNPQCEVPRADEGAAAASSSPTTGSGLRIIVLVCCAIGVAMDFL